MAWPGLEPVPPKWSQRESPFAPAPSHSALVAQRADLFQARECRACRRDAEDCPAILSPDEICAGLWPWFRGRPTETAIALFLDGSCGLVGWYVHEGTVDCTCLPVRAMIGEALALDASGLLLAHNHPSGDPTPSMADMLTTRRLCALAATLDLRVIDHLVFAGTSACFSYRQQGLL